MDTAEIPDSEGEDSFLDLNPVQQTAAQSSEISQFPVISANQPSSIQTAETLNVLPKPKPRPRPRPLRKNLQPNVSLSHQTDPIEPASSSAAERVKMRSRKDPQSSNKLASSFPSSIIEISDSEDEIRLKPIEKTSTCKVILPSRKRKSSPLEVQDVPVHDPSSSYTTDPPTKKKRKSKVDLDIEKSSGKPKANPRKGKTTNHTGEAAFKSAEFIIDSDEDGHLLPFPVDGRDVNPSSSTSSKGIALSAPDPPNVDSEIEPPKKKKKSTPVATVPDPLPPSPIQQPSSSSHRIILSDDEERSQSDRKTRVRKKSRKRTVNSEEEEEPETEQVKKKKKRKTTTPRPAKVCSDALDETELERPAPVATPHRDSSQPAEEPCQIPQGAGSVSCPGSPVKENRPLDSSTVASKPKERFQSISAGYTTAPRTKQVPMSELIRRASSKPNSPFPSAPIRPGKSAQSSASPSPSCNNSPFYLKNSKRFMSRIAPLHPNRRTPPPAPPPPPPRKKTKKELELEEKWEEELLDEIGMDSWVSMTAEERSALRIGKFKRMRGEFEDW